MFGIFKAKTQKMEIRGLRVAHFSLASAFLEKTSRNKSNRPLTRI